MKSYPFFVRGALALALLSLPGNAEDASEAGSARAIRQNRVNLFKEGKDIFRDGPLWTEPGWNLHTPAEIGIDDFQANRAPDKRYRTAPLAGIFSRPKGGFFHDGRFATLLDVVNHYNTVFRLGLTQAEKGDLIEYLKSL